jgi:hypothetical protein
MTLEQVWQLAEMPQRWILEVVEVKWLDGGSRILFKVLDGSTYMYDFERNKKWKWEPGGKDGWSPGVGLRGSVIMEARGLHGSVDIDGSFRIWEILGS